MPYQPKFAVSAQVVGELERIAVLRERILSATVQVPWMPSLQRDARVRNTHSSTAIEGNPLTLEQVRLIEEGHGLPAEPSRAKREVLNYLAGLRYVERHADKKRVTHRDVFTLHTTLAAEVMDQGDAGRYRDIQVYVGRYTPPEPQLVRELMAELLAWWNGQSREWSPVISSAILHYQFEAIHPFADGNGRTGRALALWELYRRGFDMHHIFSVDDSVQRGSPCLLCGVGERAKTGRRPHPMDRVLCPGLAGNPGSSLDAHSASRSERRTEEGDVATTARAITAVVEGPPVNDPQGDSRELAGLQARSHGSIEPAPRSRAGATQRHPESRPLHLSVISPTHFWTSHISRHAHPTKSRLPCRPTK